MFNIKLTLRARRELRQISKQHREIIGAVFEDLKEVPTLGKPLSKELVGKFSYRVGDYRIIYLINQKDKVITIVSAGHRSTVYH